MIESYLKKSPDMKQLYVRSYPFIMKTQHICDSSWLCMSTNLQPHASSNLYNFNYFLYSRKLHLVRKFICRFIRNNIIFLFLLLFILLIQSSHFVICVYQGIISYLEYKLSNPTCNNAITESGALVLRNNYANIYNIYNIMDRFFFF